MSEITDKNTHEEDDDSADEDEEKGISEVTIKEIVSQIVSWLII